MINNHYSISDSNVELPNFRCSKGFLYQSNYNNHMKTHLGETSGQVIKKEEILGPVQQDTSLENLDQSADNSMDSVMVTKQEDEFQLGGVMLEEVAGIEGETGLGDLTAPGDLEVDLPPGLGPDLDLTPGDGEDSKPLVCPICTLVFPGRTELQVK